jgi:hypothetical protein
LKFSVPSSKAAVVIFVAILTPMWHANFRIADNCKTDQELLFLDLNTYTYHQEAWWRTLKKKRKKPLNCPTRRYENNVYVWSACILLTLFHCDWQPLFALLGPVCCHYPR